MEGRSQRDRGGIYSGRVGGDARLGAGQVTVGGSVGEDLVVGAGQVTITSSGQVGEDFVFGTGRTILDGQVAGDVLGSTGTYERRGSVGGTERVNIREPRREPTLGDRLLGGLRRFASVLIVGALLLWLAPRFMDGSAEAVRRRPLATVGVGALSLVGSVVLAVVVLIVIVLMGILFGLLGLGGLFAILLFAALLFLVALAFLLVVTLAFAAPAVVGLAIGRLLLRDGSGIRRWMALLLGVLVVVVVSSAPVVGGWIGFLIALFGLGAVALRMWTVARPAPERPRRAPRPGPADLLAGTSTAKRAYMSGDVLSLRELNRALLDRQRLLRRRKLAAAAAASSNALRRFQPPQF